MIRILPFLYLGNRDDIDHVEKLKENNVQALVICCTYFEYPEDKVPSAFAKLRVNLEDIGMEQISSYFEESNNFIHSYVKKEQGVLISCCQGISRSSTMCIAYLMGKQVFVFVKKNIAMFLSPLCCTLSCVHKVLNAQEVPHWHYVYRKVFIFFFLLLFETVLISVLFAVQNFCLIEAFNFIMEKKTICPNIGFIEQLCDYEQVLKNKMTFSSKKYINWFTSHMCDNNVKADFSLECKKNTT
ncbi:protein tyrosine phosphatase, putative [Plasmodium knowlesi strain H]|uniref:protein-tyrosine-phosphatase n=1 Tax=Plasmodium knowlesi (strain H) TaxID=5851 RepID=A0A193R8D0_PLAKH|nr:protein tyrosine phosphatase, putative [Plasmodium knowlesi strain H]SBO23343.1 protein tyrosine phosphatase, putative [Plasmodium knowlesi strain H]